MFDSSRSYPLRAYADAIGQSVHYVRQRAKAGELASIAFQPHKSNRWLVYPQAMAKVLGVVAPAPQPASTKPKRKRKGEADALVRSKRAV